MALSYLRGGRREEGGEVSSHQHQEISKTKPIKYLLLELYKPKSLGSRASTFDGLGRSKTARQHRRKTKKNISGGKRRGLWFIDTCIKNEIGTCLSVGKIKLIVV
jgi:hypothetical protein